jgi:hypothetical protein
MYSGESLALGAACALKAALPPVSPEAIPVSVTSNASSLSSFFPHLSRGNVSPVPGPPTGPLAAQGPCGATFQRSRCWVGWNGLILRKKGDEARCPQRLHLPPGARYCEVLLPPGRGRGGQWLARGCAKSRVLNTGSSSATGTLFLLGAKPKPLCLHSLLSCQAPLLRPG